MIYFELSLFCFQSIKWLVYQTFPVSFLRSFVIFCRHTQFVLGTALEVDNHESHILFLRKGFFLRDLCHLCSLSFPKQYYRPSLCQNLLMGRILFGYYLLELKWVESGLKVDQIGLRFRPFLQYFCFLNLNYWKSYWSFCFWLNLCLSLCLPLAWKWQ